MFAIRQACTEDVDQILAVAEHLDTVNLPADREAIAEIVSLSVRSFTGDVDPFEREYLFVLEDLDRGVIAGTSMIHAKHGTRRAPHVYFDVIEEERYSVTIDRYLVHQCLRIGYNYDGPTEIGGLILEPQYRGRPESLGKLLSFVRFVFIAVHRPWFRDEVLSELMPPLEPDGTSLLWKHLGRAFTGLTYQDADRLSKNNKEFIHALFPHGLIYTVLFPEEVRAVIGDVGPNTRGVKKMLERIGFEYVDRIDPFDGGPHFMARTDDLLPVQSTRRGRVVAIEAADEGRPWAVVAVEPDGPTTFRATSARVRIIGDDEIGLTPDARQALRVEPGDSVWWMAP